MEKLFAIVFCFLFLINSTNLAVQKPIGILVSEKTEICSNDTTVLPTVKFGNPYSFDTILTVGHSTFRVFRDTVTYNFRILKKVGNKWQDNIDEVWTSLHEFQDWNKDGYLDIVLRYKFMYDILLFNPKKEVFVVFGHILENNIEDIQNIEGTDLKCSFYESKGDWYSQLFRTDSNYNMISYGILFYRRNYNEETQIDSPYIDVYKRLVIHDEAYQKKVDWSILDDTKELIMTIDPKKQIFYSTEDYEKSDSLRLAFVKDYWSKNYKKFIKK